MNNKIDAITKADALISLDIFKTYIFLQINVK